MREVTCQGTPAEVRCCPTLRVTIAENTVTDWPSAWTTSKSRNPWQPCILHRLLQTEICDGLDDSQPVRRAVRSNVRGKVAAILGGDQRSV